MIGNCHRMANTLHVPPVSQPVVSLQQRGTCKTPTLSRMDSAKSGMACNGHGAGGYSGPWAFLRRDFIQDRSLLAGQNWGNP